MTMKKIYLFLFLLFFPVYISAETYMTKPLYEDINLSKINFPEDNEIRELLSDNQITLNIVINYIKSIIYNNGMVSKEQQITFQQALSNISDSKKQRITEIVEKQLDRCGCKFVVIDLSGGDHYLPLKIIKANE